MPLEHLKTMTDNSRKVHSGQTLKLKLCGTANQMTGLSTGTTGWPMRLDKKSNIQDV